MKARLLGKAYLAASSDKLTFFILVYSAFFIFGMTLMQNEIGIAEAQSRYVESFFILARPFFWSDAAWINSVRVPIFGGAFIGVVAVVNLLASCTRHARFGAFGFGVSITHMALVLLILSGALQYFMRLEGRVSLSEGSKSAIVYVADGGKIRTIALPFEVELKKFSQEKWEGSNIPKSFTSDVAFLRDGKSESASISMNAPASFGGWTFYQFSTENGGRTSVLGAVRNPARMLPWLAVGSALFGMFVIFLSRTLGRKNDDEK